LLKLDVEPIERVSKGGIVIPHKENIDPSVAEVKKCTVVAACDFRIESGVKMDPEFRVGDRVYINAAPGHNGMKIQVDDEVYNIIQEVNILGKFIDENNS
jgi:co-chaperonin GroES (HSP10)